MATDIKTRWHKLLPLVLANEVYLTATETEAGQHFEETGGKLEQLALFLADVGKLPHFVIEPELIGMAANDDYQRSLFDMKRGKVLRLPYPSMVVEWTDAMADGRIHTQFVVLRDLYAVTTSFPWEGDMVTDEKVEHWAKQDKPIPMLTLEDDTAMDFYGIRMSLLKDGDGDYISMSPSIVTGAIEQRDGAPWLRFGGYGHALLPANPHVNKIVQDTYMRDIGAVFHAVSAAYLLMKTQGVDAETIDTTKINRKRSGKPDQPFVPKHTYIKIGRVYRSNRSEETDEYEPRKSPRPHWRRGHLRHVRYGVGRVNIKEIYIYPRLVALKSDSVVPPTPDYKVVK